MFVKLSFRRANKSRIPRPVLSPVQPMQDAFSKRPMTATYRADSPTSPSGANKSVVPTSSVAKYAERRILLLCDL